MTLILTALSFCFIADTILIYCGICPLSSLSNSGLSNEPSQVKGGGLKGLYKYPPELLPPITANS